MQSSWNVPLLPIIGNFIPIITDWSGACTWSTTRRLTYTSQCLTSIPYSACCPQIGNWYTVLDLNDAFFSLSLTPKSQQYFTFKWHNPEIEISSQLTRPTLPQGFKNSPTSLMKLCMRTWISTGHRTQTSVCCSLLMTYRLQLQNERPD